MSDQPRLHVSPSDPPCLAEGAALPMTPAQAHYLGGVLRRGPGDPVRLFNAADGEWQTRVAELRRDRGRFLVERRLLAPRPEPGPALLFALLKRDATDLVVRMATELGASRLQPVLTERTNTARVNPERWRAIATEAAEQCERLGLPAIGEPVRLPALLGGWDPAVPLLAALERPGPAGEPDRRVGAAAWRAGTPAPVQPGLLVGPEGGFTPEERRLLSGRGFVVPVRLGPLVLRAETACAALLAAMLC